MAMFSRIFSMYLRLLGASPPGLCPCTPLGDFRPPNLLFCSLLRKLLATPLSKMVSEGKAKPKWVGSGCPYMSPFWCCRFPKTTLAHSSFEQVGSPSAMQLPTPLWGQQRHAISLVAVVAVAPAVWRLGASVLNVAPASTSSSCVTVTY